MDLEDLFLLESDKLYNLLEQMSPQELDTLQACVLKRITKKQEEITITLEKFPWRWSIR